MKRPLCMKVHAVIEYPSGNTSFASWWVTDESPRAQAAAYHVALVHVLNTLSWAGVDWRRD